MAGTALLAVGVATAALFWNLLACTESPMAFSPDGRSLAFVTMEPYEQETELLAGMAVFRLMVRPEGRPPRVVETTTTDILSAPAFRPDGKQYCYLRIPLLSKKDATQLDEHVKKYEKFLNENPPAHWIDRPEDASPSSAADDRALPPVDNVDQLGRRAVVYPSVVATLVVRASDTDKIVSTTPVELPLLGGDQGHMMAYLSTRLQYGTDGQSVYFCAGNQLFAVKPAAGKCAVLSGFAAIGVLSPDGRTVLTLDKRTLGLVQTDGDITLYRRWEKEASPCGLAWLDAQTPVVLEPDKEPKLHLLRPDGTLRKTVTVRIPAAYADEVEVPGTLAVSPNGRFVVLAFERDTFFLKSDGTLLKHWHGEDEMIAQPTFSPDSRRVAFKLMQEEGQPYLRASVIVFFTPEGEELERVPIPPADPPIAQPAEQP